MCLMMAECLVQRKSALKTVWEIVLVPNLQTCSMQVHVAGLNLNNRRKGSQIEIKGPSRNCPPGPIAFTSPSLLL